MSEYAGAFDKEFLERTIEIIEGYKETKYEFTLLLNCTLALICLPLEKLNKSKNYELIDLVGEEIVKSQIELKGKHSEILRCLRNGIAHLRIKPMNSKNKLDKIEIIGNTNNYKLQNKFIFTYNELKELVLEIIKIYDRYSN